MRSKLKPCVALLLALLLVVLCGCVGGKTDGAELTIGPSARYNEDELHRAMDVVIDQFKKGFESCRLLTLTYDEEISLKSAGEWAAQYHADEAIVLESSFYVGGDNPTLNPYSTYKGWQWILTRNGNGKWVLQTSGY